MVLWGCYVASSIGNNYIDLFVPIPLAALHQAGALALLTASLAFSAKLKKPRPQSQATHQFQYEKQIIKTRV